MTASVTAATISRVPQLMPRLTHHNRTKLMKTGTTIWRDGKGAPAKLTRLIARGVDTMANRRRQACAA